MNPQEAQAVDRYLDWEADIHRTDGRTPSPSYSDDQADRDADRRYHDDFADSARAEEERALGL